jgi:2-aminoadipate transaminase
MKKGPQKSSGCTLPKRNPQKFPIQILRITVVLMMEEGFPAGGEDTTRPEGGVFLWATLAENMSSIELFDRAIKNDVAFVPGQAFYANGSGYNTLRLKF